MAADSIIQAVTDFFMGCPLLKDGVFRVDALGTTGIEYAIETGSFEPVIQNFIDGSSIRQYQFSFGSREYYDMDRIQNIQNSTFYEKFADWVEEQNRAGNLPELPSGMDAEELQVLSPGYIFDITTKYARYQLPLRLIYFKEV